MLGTIKGRLLANPEALKDFLECFGYANIKIRDSYLSFGRDEESSKKSIVVRLRNNQHLWVTDYPNNISQDLFSYIISQRGVSFKEVISVAKDKVGIESGYYETSHRSIFGGFYDNLSKKKETEPLKIYDESILDNYIRLGNERFAKDGISLGTQAFFNIRFDINNQAIVIPIYDQFGSLIAVKERANYEIEEGQLKYWYEVPGMASRTLYGYAKNYQYLAGTRVMVFEAEKSVMQCHSYGMRNAVGLGSGSISETQLKMIYELRPTEVLFLHDVGFEIESIMRNCNKFKSYGLFTDAKVGYWNWQKGKYPDKSSPSDLGGNELKRILREEVVYL